MPEFGYSYKPGEESAVARAQLYDINASYKDLSQVCASIKGKPAEEALQFLESASKGKAAVLYRKFNKHLGHRRELGGRKGRYPKKAAGFVLKVLRNAAANASFKGLGEMLVKHASANKQETYPRVAPKGKWMKSDYETARVEIVLEQLLESERVKKAKGAEEKEKQKKKEKASAPEAGKGKDEKKDKG